MESEPTIFLLACLVSLGLTALIRETAPRIGLTDDPDGHRKLHGRATPVGGGVGVYLTTAVILGTLWVVPGAGPAVMVWDRNDFPEGANGDTMGLFFPQLVDLSAYNSQIIQLEFRFDTADGIGNSTEGDYIDDVFVTGSCP